MATAALMSATQANAEFRKWDFSNWSAATQSAIEADALWTGDEKGNGTVFEGCYWYKAGSLAEATDAEGNLLANSIVISEMQGLKVTTWGSGWAAIGTDYQVTKDANAWGPYNGPQYLWLANKGLRIVIPAVERGTEIRIGLESHKPSDARGVDLYVGDQKVEWTTEQAGYPTTYDDYAWTIPADGEEDVVDVEIRPSNGCHLYYIEVGEDTGSDVNDINIAYLYDSSYNGAKDADKNPCGWLANGGLDADPVYAALQTYNVTAIDYNGQSLTSAELNDSLLKFDVVVAGECVSSSNALAKGLVEIVNKVPMLNLKSFMYKKGVWGWGAGQNPSPKSGFVTVAEDYLDDALFADLEIEDDGTLRLFESDEAENGNLVQGYTANADALIADDEVLATTGENINAIHRHGQKNQYLLIPLSSDNMDQAHGNLYVIVDNAVRILAATKSKVQNAAAPVIAQAAADGVTTVSITCTTSGATIYFTTDGTEPSLASAVYAEPFQVTEDGLVVKAFATAHGYNDSNVSTATIVVKGQAAAPAIAIEGLEGMTVITLTPAEGTNAYYSFNGITTVSGSSLYLEPIVVTEPATLTYFAASDVALPSELLTAQITVGGIPAAKDTVAHFTANEEAWFANVILRDYQMEEQPLPESNWAAKAAYYWGKSAWSYFSDEVDHTEAVLDEEGNPVLDINGQDSIKTVYKPDPTAVRYVYSTVDPQWRLRSQGQLFTGETNVAATYTIGGPDLVGYYAESAQDLIGQPSKGKMTFGGKGSGEPYSACIESTEAFQAPFDIVTYTTNGGGSPYDVEIQTSADGETWTAVGKLPVAETQRYYKKGRVHVDGTDALYVRVTQVGGSTKAQLYDILIVTTEGTTGIEQIQSDNRPASTTQYDLFGRALNTPVRGQLIIQSGHKVIVVD